MKPTSPTRWPDDIAELNHVAAAIWRHRNLCDVAAMDDAPPELRQAIESMSDEAMTTLRGFDPIHAPARAALHRYFESGHPTPLPRPDWPFIQEPRA